MPKDKMSISLRTFLSSEQHRVVACAILAGLLYPLLFLASLFSIENTLFIGLWGVHIGLLLAATIFSCRWYIHQVKNYESFNWLWWGLGALSLVVVAALSSLPITERDALIYHLFVRSQWIQRGVMSEISWHSWSYFPANVSLAFSGFLQLNLERLTGLYHASFLIITATCIGQTAYHCYEHKRIGIYLFLFCVTTTACLRFATPPHADLVVPAYFAIAL